MAESQRKIHPDAPVKIGEKVKDIGNGDFGVVKDIRKIDRHWVVKVLLTSGQYEGRESWGDWATNWKKRD